MCAVTWELHSTPSVTTLLQKLKATRVALVQWNRMSFGNILDRKASIEDEVVSLEEALIGEWNVEDLTS